MIVVGMAAQYISQKASWKVEYNIFMELRSKYFSTIMSYPKRRFDYNSIGNYTSKIENDVVTATETVEYALEIAENFMSLIVYAVFLFLLSSRLAAIIYAVTIITMFLPTMTAKRFSEYKNDLLKATGAYLAELNDLMRGFFSITKATRGGIINRHQKELEKLEHFRYRYGCFKAFVNVFNGSVMYLIDIISFGAIAVFLSKGMITVGVATATLTYIREFALPLRGMVDSISALKSVRPAAEKVVCEAYEEPEEKTEPSTFTEMLVENAGKDFPEIEDKRFSCKISANKKYLIQGENGAGKSTLLKMLVQVLVPDQGMVTVNGVNINELDISNLVTYIPQDNHIFIGNFLDNITWFGSMDKSNWGELRKYFSNALSENLFVQSDCSRLSGGEKQQIGLMRALMEDKPVILLDEPFSAMSLERELAFTKLLLGMKEKTVIMISHNKSRHYAELFDEIITC